MSNAAPLTYTERGANYLRQAGRAEDEDRMLADQVTPRQRRRMFHKERRSWGGYAQPEDTAFDWHATTDDLDDDDQDPHDLGYCVTPGCNCCGDDDD